MNDSWECVWVCSGHVSNDATLTCLTHPNPLVMRHSILSYSNQSFTEQHYIWEPGQQEVKLKWTLPRSSGGLMKTSCCWSFASMPPGREELQRRLLAKLCKYFTRRGEREDLPILENYLKASPRHILVPVRWNGLYILTREKPPGYVLLMIFMA